MAATYETKGIVLRCIKYSESSVIVDIYTLTKGLRSYIVSGLSSRKDRSKASCYQHLNIIQIVAYEKPAGKLARIKEQRIVQHYSTLPYDVRKSGIGLFSLEICKESIKEREPNEALYHFLEQYFVMLDNKKASLGLLPIKFLLELSTYIGIRPNENHGVKKPYLDMLAGECVEAMNKYTLPKTITTQLYLLMNTAWDDLDDIRYSKDDRVTLLDDVVMYYKLHLDQLKELKTLKVLREIF